MLINNDTIVKDTDPVIRTVSAPVPLPLSKEDEQLLREMFQYVQDSTDEEKAERLNLRPAVGISAIQLGIPKQMTAVICDDVDNNDNHLKLSIKDIDYKKDGQKLKRMAETKSGFKPLKENLEVWINEKIKEITDKM